MFLERPLNDPHHPTSSIFHWYPLPIHHSFPPPNKNFIIHFLKCLLSLFQLNIKFKMLVQISPTDIQSESPILQKSDSQILRKSDSQEVRFSDSPKVRFSDSPKVRFSESQILRFSESQILRFSESQILRFSVSPKVRFSDSPKVKFSDPTFGTVVVAAGIKHPDWLLIMKLCILIG